ncbi:hypothetical protein LOK49_LG05G00414 [Camellia lanceoleosa]|uniref:Uncharacterized protein n=1 Tax=Camellia lanceoleosa TaxID=1840588 RepID=A0ACC0HPD3_9ERIC|nr:hypothetical protein LOK49_LG05G00414 [Camellia lanceoleosa]
MTLGTSMAAHQGTVAMAAHQICLQVRLAVSLLTDALAASGQKKDIMTYLLIYEVGSETPYGSLMRIFREDGSAFPGLINVLKNDK